MQHFQYIVIRTPVRSNFRSNLMDTILPVVVANDTGLVRIQTFYLKFPDLWILKSLKNISSTVFKIS